MPISTGNEVTNATNVVMNIFTGNLSSNCDDKSIPATVGTITGIE
tara:strand:+ start:448 stop:582 length:135 start_codon:yes stop_codon:yes gene_type:complete